LELVSLFCLLKSVFDNRQGRFRVSVCVLVYNDDGDGKTRNAHH